MSRLTGPICPLLAAEIPTQANGDVSADGTVVTWKLKPGVTWSDGQPFTSADVVFTYQMIMDPANPVPNRSDYTVMDSVVAPDDATVVVTYKQLYAAYRLAFPSFSRRMSSTVEQTSPRTPSTRRRLSALVRSSSSRGLPGTRSPTCVTRITASRASPIWMR